jgi:hypothetical protein
MNPTTFILLTGIFNNVLFVSKPKNTEQCYITSNKNETFPNNWTKMNIDNTTTPRSCKISLSSSIMEYKIMYMLPNKTNLTAEYRERIVINNDHLLVAVNIITIITLILVMIYIIYSIYNKYNHYKKCVHM